MVKSDRFATPDAYSPSQRQSLPLECPPGSFRFIYRRICVFILHKWGKHVQDLSGQATPHLEEQAGVGGAGSRGVLAQGSLGTWNKACLRQDH